MPEGSVTPSGLIDEEGVIACSDSCHAFLQQSSPRSADLAAQSHGRHCLCLCFGISFPFNLRSPAAPKYPGKTSCKSQDITRVCVLTPFLQCGLILQWERCFNVYSMFNCDITNGSSNPDVVFSCQLARAVKVFNNLKAAVWRLNFVADGSDIGWNTEHCKGFSSETKQVAGHREWKDPQI